MWAWIDRSAAGGRAPGLDLDDMLFFVDTNSTPPPRRRTHPAFGLRKMNKGRRLPSIEPGGRHGRQVHETPVSIVTARTAIERTVGPQGLAHGGGKGHATWRPAVSRLVEGLRTRALHSFDTGQWPPADQNASRQAQAGPQPAVHARTKSIRFEGGKMHALRADLVQRTAAAKIYWGARETR